MDQLDDEEEPSWLSGLVGRDFWNVMNCCEPIAPKVTGRFIFLWFQGLGSGYRLNGLGCSHAPARAFVHGNATLSTLPNLSCSTPATHRLKGAHPVYRCRVNSAHIRQSRLDSGLGLSHFSGESPYTRVNISLLAWQQFNPKSTKRLQRHAESEILSRRSDSNGANCSGTN